MFKRLIAHSFVYSVGPHLPKLAGLFLLPVLTAYLGPEDYAIFGIGIAYITALSGLRDLGLTQVLVNYYYRYAGINEQRWRMIWRKLFGLILLWGIVYGVLLIILLNFSLASKVGDALPLLLFCAVVPPALFEGVTIIGSRYFQMAQRPIPVAINAAISGSIAIAVNYIAVVWYDMKFMGFFLGMFASALFSFLYFLVPVFRTLQLYPVFKIQRRRFSSHLKVALPTIPHNYSAYLLGASDRVMLDLMKQPLARVGQYNFAYTFGNYAEMFGNSVGMAVGPIYLSLYAKRSLKTEQDVALLTFILQFCFLAGSYIVALWTKELFALLSSNADLAASYPYAVIIIMSYAYRPMYWATVNKLGFSEQTHHLWKISFIGGLLNVLLNLMLIPYWGVLAAVVSTFIGLMYIGFSGFFLKAFKAVNHVNYHPVKWLTGIILSTVLVFLCRDLPVGQKLGMTLVIAVLGFVVFHLYRKRILLLGQEFSVPASSISKSVA
jgi:O-antigen/teichoic acid export membrane protein